MRKKKKYENKKRKKRKNKYEKKRKKKRRKTKYEKRIKLRKYLEKTNKKNEEENKHTSIHAQTNRLTGTENQLDLLIPEHSTAVVKAIFFYRHKERYSELYGYPLASGIPCTTWL